MGKTKNLSVGVLAALIGCKTKKDYFSSFGVYGTQMMWYNGCQRPTRRKT